MRSSSRAFAALVVVCLLSVAALAVTLASRFAEFRSELQTEAERLSSAHLTKLERRQKTAVRIAIRALDRDQKDLAHQISGAATVAAAIERGGYLNPFEGPGRFGDEISDMISTLGTDVSDLRNSVAAEISQLAGAKRSPRGRAEALLAKADAKLSAFEAALTAAAEFRALRAALRSLLAAQKIVTKAQGGGGGTTFSVSDGSHLLSNTVAGASFECSYLVNLDDADMSFAANVGGDFVAIAVHVPAPSTGTKDVSPQYFAYVAGLDSYDVMSGAITGTVTFSVWDPAHGKAKGSLDVTFTRTGSPDVHVTGTFETGSVAIDNS